MKNKFDSFYTPAKTAEDLVKNCSLINPRTIVDFAAGNGALLSAAANRFPNAKISLNDLSSDCIAYHTTNNQSWNTSNLDFLNTEQVCELTISKNLADSFDLIILNPPFSQKGGSYCVAVLDELRIKCSTAFAFVINSLNFLSRDGELLAIVPASCLTSEKDAVARKHLQQQFYIQTLSHLSKRTFLDCSVNTVCIKIRWKKDSEFTKHEESSLLTPNSQTIKSIKLLRGKLQVSKAKNFYDSTGYKFVHTTNLLDGQLANLAKIIKYSRSIVHGPCILIPRVCKPSLKKIVVYSDDNPIVISDCIIAIFPSFSYNIQYLENLIKTSWLELQSSYSGTCAQYITLKKICLFFEEKGVSVEIQECSELYDTLPVQHAIMYADDFA